MFSNISFSELSKQLLYNPDDPVLFNSGFFFAFFALFLLLYQFVYRNKLTRVLLFTIFSLYFFSGLRIQDMYFP